MITQEELKKHIHYDPFTGEFLRIGYYDGWVITSRQRIN